jgi:hypothetical protein
VAQLVERDAVDVGAVQGLLETADQLRAVERVAGLGTADDEIAVVLVIRPVVQLAERDSDALAP